MERKGIKTIKLNNGYVFMGSRDSSVGIALCYGLEDRGSTVRFPAGTGNFSLHHTASRTALRPTQPPIQWMPRALSLGVKRPGRETDHSPPSSAEVKEWVELYLHSPVRLNGVVLQTVPRVKLHGAIPPLPYTSSWHRAWLNTEVFMAWYLVKYRGIFTFSLYVSSLPLKVIKQGGWDGWGM
jgi:hypothetical protein